MAKKSKLNFSNPPVIVLDLLEEQSHVPNEEIFKQISEKAREYGYSILDIRVTHGFSLPGTNIIGLITNKRTDDPIVRYAGEKGCKIVRVNTFPMNPSGETIPEVVPDMLEAGRLGAQHLVERKFKNLAYVGHYPLDRNLPDIYTSFKKHALSSGCDFFKLEIRPLAKWVPERDEKKNIEYKAKQVQEWLREIPKPIGILTYHDFNAAEIYANARISGFEVPEEIALIGYGNNSIICESLPVPLSSIDINKNELGLVAINTLHKLITGEPIPESPVFIPPIGIVDRQSTNLLAVADPIVARGLRFIWDHFSEQISIEDVAISSGVGRSTIARKFKHCLGRTINAEILRKRLERACELLRSSMMTIADIADSSGFPTPTYFHVAFRNTYGMTPGEFRQKNVKST